MSQLALPASFGYLYYGSTAFIKRFWRLMSVPALEWERIFFLLCAIPKFDKTSREKKSWNGYGIKCSASGKSFELWKYGQKSCENMAVIQPLFYTQRLNWAGKPPEDGEMYRMTLPSRHRDRNSRPAWGLVQILVMWLFETLRGPRQAISHGDAFGVYAPDPCMEWFPEWFRSRCEQCWLNVGPPPYTVGQH